MSRWIGRPAPMYRGGVAPIGVGVGPSADQSFFVFFPSNSSTAVTVLTTRDCHDASSAVTAVVAALQRCIGIAPLPAVASREAYAKARKVARPVKAPTRVLPRRTGVASGAARAVEPGASLVM